MNGKGSKRILCGNAAVIAENQEMKDLLKELQWTSFDPVNEVNYCFECGVNKGKQHKSDCKLAKFIK